MPDADIIELAHAEDAIIITMDKDFGELEAVRIIYLPQIIRLPDCVIQAGIFTDKSVYFAKLSICVIGG